MKAVGFEFKQTNNVKNYSYLNLMSGIIYNNFSNIRMFFVYLFMFLYIFAQNSEL